MKTLAERFWEKVDKTEWCWNWTSAVSGSNDYGTFWVGGEKRCKYAHRLSWELVNGPIPEGLVVCHKCDNPKCVRPDHLFIGTTSDNNKDKTDKRRHSYGEANKGGGKLNWEKARAIRASSVGCTTLGRQYGVSSQTVKAIRRGWIWKQELDPANA